MEKDILNKIRQECTDMKKIIRGDLSEIKELEKNPAVQRYCYLMSLKNSQDLIERGERAIIGQIIEKYGNGRIEKTNDIWCFLFELPAEKIKKIPLGDVEKNQIMAVYQDIEDSSRMIAITKDEQEEFESTHNVVLGNSKIFDESDRYYNIRHKFFDACINSSQEEAIQKVLSKTNI